MFRKTLIATAVVGAGLASTAGVAMAHEHHDAGKSCSNAAEAASKNSSGDSLGDTTGGAQALDLSNTCDILNGNKIGSGNNVASALGTIVNGDTTDITRSSTTTDTSDESTTVTPPAPAL
ncbi:hypothetical protein [Actinomycetospora termitidis]|uniref:Secreted protein n=1 Tax=Actinomycetospora termitidis TaxID=3053470 RepID=A0ABT7M4I0_9PSEU|nr:hypothetical protein [Actinomycetospora sp. Odt1-22]MDL5155587.1 hypothetical protein [Actinomycetospora sp. Odt1-22]